MLVQAKEKQVYDGLHQMDLVEFLNGGPKAFDAMTCAATLIHFGGLRPVFEAAAHALRRMPRVHAQSDAATAAVMTEQPKLLDACV
jgi:predicted TPR repeat methyltransferase